MVLEYESLNLTKTSVITVQIKMVKKWKKGKAINSC